MTSRDRPLPAEVYRQSPGGLRTIGCLAIFLGIPFLSLGLYAFTQSTVAGLAVTGGIGVIGFLLYAFFNEESLVTIDDVSMRLSHRSVILGLRGKEKIEWELPIAKLTEAREVTAHSPSKNGGWIKSTTLRFPTGLVLQPALLGGEQEGTVYRQLTAALEKRLGDRFTRAEDFGPLNKLKG